MENIKSYIGEQLNRDDMCDLAHNSLADDEFSSYKITNKDLRTNVEKYFIEKFDIKFIDNN